jgi:glucose/arabinose dehydrogenase
MAFMKQILVIGIIIVALGGFVFAVRSYFQRNPQYPPRETQTITPKIAKEIGSIKIIAEHLDTPWGIAVLPDTSLLITERPGRVRFIDSQSHLREEPIATISAVKEIGEGGLLGICIHPSFNTNGYIYLYYTYASEQNNTLNRVVRMTYADGTLSDEKIILDAIPGAENHNGGRIRFGPDNYLYVTTGDAQQPSQAQDIHALGGKILRMTDEGKIPNGNPFSNLVYSYGHRNPQGLAWDGKKRLWSTEHGPSGGVYGTGRDELNLIDIGKNYGWPNILGDDTNNNMVTPVIHSGTDTWAPASLAYHNNALYFGGLKGEALYKVDIENENYTLQELFKQQFRRIREVVVGPDNILYVTTSNNDSRGKPQANDDLLLQIQL